jgi:tape measure domain-containing protein
MAGFKGETKGIVDNIGDMYKASLGLEGSLTRTSSAYKSLGGAMKPASENAGHAAHSFFTLSSMTKMAMGTLQFMLIGGLIYGVANGLMELAKGAVAASDGWVNMQAKLKNATGSTENAVKAQADLYDLSMRMRVPMEDLTKLYTRMVVPLQKIGKGMGDAKAMVEGVNLALQLNGSTAGEASSVMLQFSQSIAAGRLNGAEFNAVAENAPPILRAIEDELKRTGDASFKSGESLKKMAAEGKLGVELIHSAIMNAIPKWRREFENLPITV